MTQPLFDPSQVRTPDQLLTEIILGWRRASDEFGDRASMLMDLDDTTLDTNYRTAAIMDEWFGGGHSGLPLDEAERMGLRARDLLDAGRFTYSSMDNITLVLGAAEAQRAQGFWVFWKARFFGNTYLAHDMPYLGVQEFIAAILYEIDLSPSFLTGRHDATTDIGAPLPLGMRRGTELALRRIDLELPVIYKPRYDTPDKVYKHGIFAHEDMVPFVIIDNEPENLIAYLEAMKARGLSRHALAVLFDSIRREDTPLPPEVLVLQRYTHD